ncbi:DUF3962 domain-containing protein [Coleofasciculus sp. FACHB-1120]|uniref:pPIWI_RE module domain-containing protein n=1 Tax=Coleofasciculus sp. FACHB-1120 TaxID=2692783 RepID=UPI001687DEBB|nr:DUF3962 domain-containing protein [Coleofasciculus sp. FACHB-1120]MBD2743621.1 DUF3962 domain-containing protein [Coleofasciculus sp. FACHB-1120]
MRINYILPGAWELTEEAQTPIYAINVPTAWRQVAKALTARRSRGSYRSIPVRSLDTLISATFPQIIYTNRRSWSGDPVPWIYATDRANIEELPFLVQGWFREEFGATEEVEAAISNLRHQDWQWFSQVYSPSDEEIRWQGIPDYLARQLQGATIAFGLNRQYPLQFYRVNRFEDGAELMSFPPTDIPVGKGKVSVSFVILLKLHTVPWRKEPLIYHALSLRRWVTSSLIKNENGEFRYRGVTAYIGDTRRWLDGAEQPFSFITLRMKRGEEEPYWHPHTITELLRDAGEIPEPKELASNPVYNWHQFNRSNRTVQAAIPVGDRLRRHPCLPGVSPLDLARLDQEIAACLPVERVGEGVRVQQANSRRLTQVSNKRLMLHPEIASPAASKVLRSQPTVLILWETEAIRDALIAELCRLLTLAPTSESNIYAGEYGSLQILTQDVGILGNLLDVGSFSVPARNRQQRRVQCLEERIQLIANSVPRVEGLKGALVEIIEPPNIPEADPKLAWRVGLAQAGYVNQHLHALKEVDEEDTSRKAAQTRTSNKERVKRAVTDLLRQWGVLSNSLIQPEVDYVEPHTWLTCLSILRRTRRTNVQGIPHTAAIMVRVNPVSGEVQATTPQLWRSQRWASYPDVLQHLTAERWEPNSWFDESNDESSEERTLLTQFVAQCLQDCLNTPIADVNNPYVLFMAEAHNTRSKLSWLHNRELLDLAPGNLPNELKRHIQNQEKRDRLWIVRLRTTDDMEVPVYISKNSEGSRTKGVFEWQNVCDQSKRQVYLSISQLPSSAKFVLRRSQSRLDSAKSPAGQVKPLEIAPIYHPGIPAEQLVQFVHSLRKRWLYFADTVALPFPLPFATKAKEYAVSVRDNAETLEAIEEVQLEDE